MKTAVLLAFLITMSLSCTTHGGTASKRILALGDSYTIGEAVSAPERWPNQLADLLRQAGIETGDPQIIAKTGWTTDELASAIDTARPMGPYALVTLLVGVNNQYRGREAEEYRREFVALLQRAVRFAGDDPLRVIVVSIPDWGVTPFAGERDRAKIAAEIDLFNHINREETVRVGARYVDVTPISRVAATDRTLLADDGLHPSGTMYRQWAALVFPQARAALGGR